MVAGSEALCNNAETKCVNWSMNEHRLCVLIECPKLFATRDKVIWYVETELLFVDTGWDILQKRGIRFSRFLGQNRNHCVGLHQRMCTGLNEAIALWAEVPEDRLSHRSWERTWFWWDFSVGRLGVVWLRDPWHFCTPRPRLCPVLCVHRNLATVFMKSWEN